MQEAPGQQAISICPGMLGIDSNALLHTPTWQLERLMYSHEGRVLEPTSPLFERKSSWRRVFNLHVFGEAARMRHVNSSSSLITASLAFHELPTCSSMNDSIVFSFFLKISVVPVSRAQRKLSQYRSRCTHEIPLKLATIFHPRLPVSFQMSTYLLVVLVPLFW